MFRRKQEDDDPFAALNEANKRGATTIATGSATAPPRPSAGGSGGGSGGSGGSDGRADDAFGAPKAVPSAPKRRRNGPLVLLTIVASLGAAGALVAFSSSPADDDAERGWFSYARDGPGRSDAGDSGDRDKPRGERPPKHVDLVQPTGFGGALAAIQRTLRRGERVWLLRVDRTRVTALTRLPNGDQRSISVDDELATNASDSGSAGSHKGIPLSRISALAPSLATRNAARAARVGTRKLDYLVMTTPIIPGDHADWQVFFRDVPARDGHFAASLDGRTVRRPGESSTTSSTLSITTNGKTRTISGAQAQRITDCIRRAGTDGARIRRCLP